METPKKSLDWKWLITTIILLAIFGAVIYMLRQQSARISGQIEGADRRMSQIETAVHILAGADDQKTRQLVDVALTVSQNSASSGADLIASVKGYMDKGDAVKAAEVASSARILILAAKNQKALVPPGYFTNTLGLLNKVGAVSDDNVARELFATRVALAEYRSSLEPIPDVPAKQEEMQARAGAIAADTFKGGVMYHTAMQETLPTGLNLRGDGAVINASDVPQGDEFLKPVGVTFAANKDTVSGMAFDGVTQTLDGIEWNDVVFINSRIRYRGGDLKLDHVRFVNCTFEVPKSATGTQFADYAAFQNATLKIG